MVRVLELAATRLAAGATARLGTPYRLRLAAWQPCSAPLALPALLALADGLPNGATIDASGLADDTVFPPRIGRVLLNLLLVAAEALPQGGTIRMAGSAQDLFIRLDGTAAAWPAGLAIWARDEAAAQAGLVSEAGFQGALAALLAAGACIDLSFVMPPTWRPEPPILRVVAG